MPTMNAPGTRSAAVMPVSTCKPTPGADQPQQIGQFQGQAQQFLTGVDQATVN